MEKIKSIAEYQQLANRTCPDLGNLEDNFLHMQLGVITEVGEALDCFKKNFAYKKPIDKVNLGEEFADILWYIANRALLSKQESTLALWQNDAFLQECKQDFIDTFKPLLGGNVKEAIDMLHAISSGTDLGFNELNCVGIPEVSMIMLLCESFELDFYQILTNNIEKLKIRYPEKFTEEAALNRDLDSERKALEKN